MRAITHTTLALAALVAVATTAHAQDPLTAAKQKALGAKAAADAHTAAMQKPEASAPSQGQKAPAKPAPAPQGSGARLPDPKQKPGTALDVGTVGAEMGGPPPTIYREVFTYARDGRRDPFVSLLTTNELRPTLSDLRLTGILFDHTGRNSIATLRDLTNNAQYRVSVGSTLGRMRVTAIRTLTVVFTIDEFGTTRRDSLTLRDSTNKARGK
jgi:hypothetical protein